MNTNKNIKECYDCGIQLTDNDLELDIYLKATKEHAPPECFYPTLEGLESYLKRNDSCYEKIVSKWDEKKNNYIENTKSNYKKMGLKNNYAIISYLTQEKDITNTREYYKTIGLKKDKDIVNYLIKEKLDYKLLVLEAEKEINDYLKINGATIKVLDLNGNELYKITTVDIKSKLIDISKNKNLITVPSCNEHNNGKSGTDDYLRAVIVYETMKNNGFIYETNTFNIYASILYDMKVEKSIVRNFKDYISQYEIKMGTYTVPYQDFVIDIARINEGLESMAKAIYYHEFKQRYNTNISINSILHLGGTNNTYKEQKMRLKQLEIAPISWGTAVKGPIHDIFNYQFDSKNSSEVKELVLTFYNTVKVYISFKY